MAVAQKQASCEQVRSFDHNVFFRVDGGDSGWALLDAFAHGIAAASQLTGKKVFISFTNFNPNGAAPGVGSFDGVSIACNDF
jgi:hypothetical protein